MYHVISIAVDGYISAMHNDKFDLSFLGKQSIKRASEITFNEETQKWDIKLLEYKYNQEDIEELNRFNTYEEARQVEVEWLNICREKGIVPILQEGITHLKRIRYSI